MIHSALLPLNDASVGGVRVMEKYSPVVSLAKYNKPAVLLFTYCTKQ